MSRKVIQLYDQKPVPRLIHKSFWMDNLQQKIKTRDHDWPTEMRLYY